MASSSQSTAAFAPLSNIPSAQIILYTIKLQPPPTYKGEMDYKVTEAWIYSIDNYFLLTSLSDTSQ